jgi:hypothetical protein
MKSSAAGGGDSLACARDGADDNGGDCQSASADLVVPDSIRPVTDLALIVIVVLGRFDRVRAIHTAAGARRSHSSRAPSEARAPTVVNTHRSRRVSERRTAGSVTSYVAGSGGD